MSPRDFINSKTVKQEPHILSTEQQAVAYEPEQPKQAPNYLTDWNMVQRLFDKGQFICLERL